MWAEIVLDALREFHRVSAFSPVDSDPPYAETILIVEDGRWTMRIGRDADWCEAHQQWSWPPLGCLQCGIEETD